MLLKLIKLLTRPRSKWASASKHLMTIRHTFDPGNLINILIESNSKSSSFYASAVQTHNNIASPIWLMTYKLGMTYEI